MSLRGDGKGKTAAVYITFSDDAINWDPPRQLHGLDRYSEAGQRSGLIGVPGGQLLSTVGPGLKRCGVQASCFHMEAALESSRVKVTVAAWTCLRRLMA